MSLSAQETDGRVPYDEYMNIQTYIHTFIAVYLAEYEFYFANSFSIAENSPYQLVATVV